MVQTKPKKNVGLKQDIRVVLGVEQRAIVTKTLGILNSDEKTRVIEEIELSLSVYASELGNSLNVILRSDCIAEVKPLAALSRKLVLQLHALSPPVGAMMNYVENIDYVALGVVLTRIDHFLDWARSEPSMKGGERASYEKGLRDDCKKVAAGLFDQYVQQPEATRRYGTLVVRRNTFVQMAIRAVRQASRRARISRVE